ncbi:hypothetical protein GCM10007385_02640 [Tateyamaria omphalii]|nr:hypothetical protein GCM10007385_02640 [Tateyamaria omphalii]
MYHCFSRLSRDEETEIGCADRTGDDWYKELCTLVLQGVLEFGFLLRPEDKMLRVHLSGTAEEDVVQFYEQCRCSFTLSDARGLTSDYPVLRQSHRDLFGDIAVAVPTHLAKMLGMHPCLYSHDDIDLGYDQRKDDAEHDLLGTISAVNAQFTQVTDILRILAIVESKSREAQPKNVRQEISSLDALTSEIFQIKNPVKKGDDSLVQYALSLSPENAKFIIDVTDLYRESMYDLAGKMEIIQSLFQSISASSRSVPFHYYDQQEWRLVRSISDRTIISCLDLQRDPYSVRGFYNKKYSEKARSHVCKVADHRNKGCKSPIDFSNFWMHWGLDVVASSSSLNIYSIIDHIICPKGWKNDVQGLVRKIGVRRGLMRKTPIQIFDWDEIGVE